MSENKEKKPITVYHVHFFDVQQNYVTKSDFYFGSISAIFEHFDKSVVGIQASSLYNYNFDEVTNPVYENKKCRIRKGILMTKSKSG